MNGDNDYPNPDNFPAVSFKSPIPPPDVDPDAGDLYLVAYNPFWGDVLSGAVMALLQPSTWQGSHDAIIQAQNRANNLAALLRTEFHPDVGTPYWDDSADVDDSAPAATQTWYGTVSNPEAPVGELTFAENALVWGFTGLIAAATWEIGFAPAILFHTIAPRFLLATKRGDVGEIIRILIDGEEAARVDTSGYAAGEIINTPIVTTNGAETHEIMIVQVS